MPHDDASELSLSASREVALQALLDALPKDAVVREEDDGVGRFAGERTVAVIGRGHTRVSLFRGTWGTIKPRLDRPQLAVELEDQERGVVVRLSREPEAKPGLGAHLGDLLNRALTVAVAVVAYYWVQSLPIDYALVAGIAVGGGIVWTIIATLIPQKPKRTLEDEIRDALAPLVKRKKKKKKKKSDPSKADPTPANSAPADPDPDDSDAAEAAPAETAPAEADPADPAPAAPRDQA